ncbi:hypothetical protein [Streptomyces sp. bgisy031]|uniref:hypothetical protein n=1 Tax=Streptomyces sp. bgisy031 TaxID=3413772 RepID=UPI003D73F3FE
MTVTAPVALAPGMAARLRCSPGATGSGSLYAAPPEHRASVARLLTEQQLWVHADVFADRRTGVDVDLISSLADDGTGPVDVHLLTAGSLYALDAVCRPGIARVTFPYEGVADHESVAARIRSAGAHPWVALAPGTTWEACADVLPHVDGVLVMLIEPGTRSPADPALLAKVAQAAHATVPVGVDGGVGEADLDRVLGAGASYVVAGRSLLALDSPFPNALSSKEHTS